MSSIPPFTTPPPVPPVLPVQPGLAPEPDRGPSPVKRHTTPPPSTEATGETWEEPDVANPNTPLQYRARHNRYRDSSMEKVIYGEIADHLMLTPDLVEDVFASFQGIMAEEIAAGNPLTIPKIGTITWQATPGTVARRFGHTITRLRHPVFEFTWKLRQLMGIARWYRHETADWFIPYRHDWWTWVTTLNDHPVPPIPPGTTRPDGPPAPFRPSPMDVSEGDLADHDPRLRANQPPESS